NTNLRCHLYKVHPQDYDEVIVKNKWNYKLSTQTNNTSVHNNSCKICNEAIPPFTPDTSLKQLICFIIANDQSIHVVECPEFHQLCMILRETLVNADIPGRNKMREAVLNQWRTSFEELKLELSANIWSNANLAAYLALTSHWISQDKSTGHLTIKAALIGFHRIKKRHTGVNIANTILELLDWADNNAVAMQELEHQLDEPKTAIAVGFNHRNNHVQCYAHIINICSSHIVASVTSTPKSYISNLKVPIDSNIVTCNHPWLTHIKRDPLWHARRVIRLLHSSDQHREGFHMFICDGNQCNWFTAKDCDGKHAPIQVPELQPLRDVKTRWDSVYMMLQHLRELRPAIDLYFETELVDFSCFKLLESDCEILEGLEAVLTVPHAFQQSMLSESTLVLLRAIFDFEMFM
ncbi:hypothetical protein V8E53_006850, partial [Lactarius tabidus]